MSDTVQDLFDRLDLKHPDWEEWSGEWERYRDVLGDMLVDKATYLPRNKLEPIPQYDFRLEMSELIPESGLAIDRLLGALYSEKPKRDLKDSKSDLKDFMDKSTMRGDSWNALMEQTGFNLLGYGTIRLLINVPPADIESERELSRKEEQDLDLRPWATNYTPLSVTDWEHDENGKLLFARIKEERTVKDKSKKKDKSNNQNPHRIEIRFIEYNNEDVEWWVFLLPNGKDDKLKLDDHQKKSHGLGVIPMVVEEVRTVKPFVGHSFIRYSSRADILKFRAESDLVYDTYMHAHPFLAIWTEDELKDLGIGTNQYLKLNPGNEGVGREDAKYLESPSSAFDALHRLVDEERTQIFRQAQVDPMGIVASGNQAGGSVMQASGVSRAWSFGTSEARILQRVAARLEQIERQVFEIVLRWQLPKEQTASADKVLFKGDVNYPESYDLASTAQLLEERGQIAAMVNSPTLIRVLDKRIAASKVGDTTAEELAKIQGEIDLKPLMGTMSGLDEGSPFGFPKGTDEPLDSSTNGKKVEAKKKPGEVKKKTGAVGR